MTALNATAFVAAGSAAAPGMQTVIGSCTPPTGSSFFYVTAYGPAEVVSLVSGGKSTEILDARPLAAGQSYPPNQQTGTGTSTRDLAFAEFSAPNFLTVSQGDIFT
jgi:hypothetical protein